MARWQVTEASYFKTIPPVEWEYKEVSNQTGRQGRVVMQVPMLLEPKDSACQTPPGSGEIVVCHQGKGLPSDIVFEGPPTQSMIPLDDEATAITDRMRPGWDHPIESLPAQGQGLSPETLAMMESFAKQIGDSIKAPVQSISRAEFDALRNQIEALTKQNAELKAAAVKRV